jgi:hypothetical protein
VEVGEVLAVARAEWPIRTGRSRAGLRMVTEISDDSVRVLIENPIPYAYFVRPKDWFGAETAWMRLVRKPMKEVGLELVRDPRYGRVIADALREAGGG